MWNYFLEGKWALGHRCKTKHFSRILSINNIGKIFFTTKRQRSSKNCFCYTSLFFRDLSQQKIWRLNFQTHLTFFFMFAFPFFLLNKLFTSFSNILATGPWFAFTCLFKMIFHLSQNMDLTCFWLVFLNLWH